MADYSISKCLRTDKPKKKNGKYPIYLRVRVDGKETKIPTNLEVKEEDWNDKKKEPKDVQIRALLAKKISEFEQKMNQAKIEGLDLTIDIAKEIFNGKRDNKPEKQPFYEYYEQFIRQKRKEGITEGTIHNYIGTLNVLREFKKDIRICDISLELIERFDDYLSEEKGYQAGGRQGRHSNIKAVVNDIIRHKIKIDNPYDFFKIPQAKVGEVFLTMEEIEQMRRLRPKLSHSSKEYKVLQMYLFSCYSGLRFSDVQDLKWMEIDFDKNIIAKKQIKTQEAVTTILVTYARAVLLEISKGKTLLGTPGHVFSRVSSTTANSILSELATMANITKHITFHSARRSFATILANNGYNVFMISNFMGHKSIETTQRYMKYNVDMAVKMAKEIKVFEE